MSGVKLVVKHAFGINSAIKNGLIFCDDHQIAYVCGHQVVIFNTESKEQFFISPTALPGFQSQGITAIACAYKKKLVAIAEKADPVAVVSFYDTNNGRKRKILNYPDLGSKEIRSVAFSEDCRFCLTLGAGPEWNLVLWAVEKFAKVISTHKISHSDDTPFYQVSYCPWDSTLILVIGKSALKVFRIVDSQLKPVTLSLKREISNFLSYCWLEEDEKLVIGTEAGEILLLENLEFRSIIYPTGNEPVEEIRPVLEIIATSRGFVIGTTMGELRFFERNPNMKDNFIMEDSFQIPKESSGLPRNILDQTISNDVWITGLALGTDDSIICATNTDQLLTFSLSQLKAIKDGIAPPGTGVEFLLTSFHGSNNKGEAAITGIDVAMWKPIVVTCGKDRTIRIWNTNERKLELIKHVDEEPSCLSVHPSGMYVSVGFSNRITIYSVLIDNLETTGTIACRNCSAIKYSSGGHFIASINASNIHIFNSFNGSLICVLRGHSSKVCNIIWQNLDSRLMSIGTDGAVLFWDLYPPQCRSEHYHSKIGTTFISGTGYRNGNKAYMITSDKNIKEITINRVVDAALLESVTIVESANIDYGINFDHMLIDENRKLLLLCTSQIDLPGSILFVLASPNINNKYDILTLHDGPITAICQSHNGLMIFTGDINGCLCMSEYEIEPGGTKTAPKIRDSGAAFEFEDEVLIHKADIEMKRTKIREMSTLVGELTSSNEHQLRMKEIEYLEVAKRSTDMYSSQLTDDENTFYETFNQKKQMEQNFLHQMNVLNNKNSNELVIIDLKSKAKVDMEEHRHAVLVRDTEETNRRWDKENKALVESHQAYIREMTLMYENKLKIEQSCQRDAQRDKEQLQVEFNINRINTELDADIEIAVMKTKQELKLKHEEEMGVDLMAQHALLRKNLHVFQKDVDTQRDEIRKLKDKEVRLTDTIKSLEKDIYGHKKEIREREETISDKEKRIFDLKKKNQELEKFRFVLDYKIKELKLQIAPRETEITTMKKQGEDMNLELEQYHKSNLALNLMIEELKLKLEGLRRELLNQKDYFVMNEKLHEKFKRDLSEIWIVRDKPVQLKEKFLNLYREYVQEDHGSNSGINKNKNNNDNNDDKSDNNDNNNNNNNNNKNNKNNNNHNSLRKRPNNNNEDPQISYSRDRDMLERSLEGLRRALKTDILSNKREVTKMMKERSQLTKELNMLRRDAGELRLQFKAIDQAGLIGPKMDINVLNDTLSLLGVNIVKKVHVGGFGFIGTVSVTANETGTVPHNGSNHNNSDTDDKDTVTTRQSGIQMGGGGGERIGMNKQGGIRKGFGVGVGNSKGIKTRELLGSKSAGTLQNNVSIVRSSSTPDIVMDRKVFKEFVDSNDTYDEIKGKGGGGGGGGTDEGGRGEGRGEGGEDGSIIHNDGKEGRGGGEGGGVGVDGGYVTMDWGNGKGGKKGDAGILPQNEKISPGKTTKGSGSTVHRTIALRTTSACGRVESTYTVGEGTGTVGILRQKKLKNDRYEAMKEIEMQNMQMIQAEEQLRILCDSLGISADDLIDSISANLSYP